jgi:hypothetical protein
MRMRFFSFMRPAFVALPSLSGLRSCKPAPRYHLVVSERMVWHPALGWRPTTEYNWLPIDAVAGA